MAITQTRMQTLIEAGKNFRSCYLRVKETISLAVKDVEKGEDPRNTIYKLLTAASQIRLDETLLSSFEEENAHFKFNASKNDILRLNTSATR